MTKIRALFAFGILLTVLACTCSARSLDCSYICLNGYSSPYCNCVVKTPFRWGKRSIRVPFRYGKRSYDGNLISQNAYDEERYVFNHFMCYSS